MLIRTNAEKTDHYNFSLLHDAVKEPRDSPTQMRALGPHTGRELISFRMHSFPRVLRARSIRSWGIVPLGRVGSRNFELFLGITNHKEPIITKEDCWCLELIIRRAPAKAYSPSSTSLKYPLEPFFSSGVREPRASGQTVCIIFPTAIST